MPNLPFNSVVYHTSQFGAEYAKDEDENSNAKGQNEVLGIACICIRKPFSFELKLFLTADLAEDAAAIQIVGCPVT